MERVGVLMNLHGAEQKSDTKFEMSAPFCAHLLKLVNAPVLAWQELTVLRGHIKMASRHISHSIISSSVTLKYFVQESTQTATHVWFLATLSFY